jgi:hypothetical protein
MIQIGRTKIIKLRARDKATGKLTPKLNAQGQQEERTVADQIWRETKGELDGSYGKYRRRKLTVGFVEGDCLAIYPKGTRQREIVSLFDIYRWALHAKANKLSLEKARNTKKAKDQRRMIERIRRADRRLSKPL